MNGYWSLTQSADTIEAIFRIYYEYDWTKRSREMRRIMNEFRLKTVTSSQSGLTRKETEKTSIVCKNLVLTKNYAYLA